MIVGGNGTMGSLLTRLIWAEEKPVRVMTRTPNKAAELKKLGAEVVKGDLLARYPIKLNRLEEWARRRVQAGTLSVHLAVAG